MQTLFAWLLMGLLLIAAYPSAAVALRGDSARTLKALLGLAFAVGALSLILFWEGVIGVRFTLIGVVVPYAALMLPGALWWRQSRRDGAPRSPEPPRRFALLILLLISAAILFNAAYFPFYRDDTLGIYKPQAQQMFQIGGLIPLRGADSLYLTYAPALPLVYTFAYLASGWENDYLARALSALLAVGCLPAAYLLAKGIAGASAGWLAALALALTPAFGKWASSGYVDLPMAFSYTLAAVFALRLWDSRRVRDAALCGALIGLAAWTKNAGVLIGIPVLIAWLAWSLLNRRIDGRGAAAALLACAAVAAPWYVRNQIGAGFIIPGTAWTDQAQRTLASLFVFVTRPENFAVTGWLILISGALAVVEIVRRRLNAPAQLLILAWTLPFFAAWWLFVSYDPRFLLLFLPPLCALVGVWLSRAWALIPAAWTPRLIGRIAVVLFALYIVYQSVDYKDDILRDPLMSHEQKQALVLTR
jgi:4-amino-4-deoxy-L-arabinose transferase-like glycosyltransferase